MWGLKEVLNALGFWNYERSKALINKMGRQRGCGAREQHYYLGSKRKYRIKNLPIVNRHRRRHY
jgi:hypothetical protein